MRPIKPVHLNDTGAAVSNLHKGLLLFIANESMVPSQCRKLLGQLARDLRTETFGMATYRLVRIYQ